MQCKTMTKKRGPAALLRACLRRAAHASAPARASCLLRPHRCGSVRHSETSGPLWSAHGRTQTVQTLWSGSVQGRKDCNDARPGPTGWMAVAQDWWRVQRSEPGGRRGPTACPNCTKLGIRVEETRRGQLGRFELKATLHAAAALRARPPPHRIYPARKWAQRRHPPSEVPLQTPRF